MTRLGHACGHQKKQQHQQQTLETVNAKHSSRDPASAQQGAGARTNSTYDFDIRELSHRHALS